MKRIIAVILAGGQGRRMDTLCHLRPKPALPFAGSYRIIDFTLSNCIHSQINQVAVLADYKRLRMANYLRRWRSANTSFEKLVILEPQKGSYGGTADAVYQNLGYLERYNADAVLILASDHIYKMDYRNLLAYHEHVKADVTVGVAPVPVEQVRRFGIVVTDAEGQIVDFAEKPRLPRSNLASMGIYVFRPETLFNRLREDAARADSPHDFGYAIVPGIVKRDRVFAYKFNGYWRDIGNLEAYYEANMELIYPKPSYSLGGTWPIITEDSSLPSPKTFRQGTIDNSIVSPGCTVKGRVENSILAPGVRVEEQAVVKDAVLMANVFVGYNSIVDRCVLDEEVKIGELCYIGFGSGLFSGDSGITVLGEGVTVPSYTTIGSNCKILPHASMSDFTTNALPSGSIISSRSTVRGVLI